MRRFVLLCGIVAASFLASACSSVPMLRAEAAADGKITAGPVVIAGLEVAPRYDVVDGVATVVVSSTPPFLTINLDPRASFANSMTPDQEKAINEGRVAIYRMGNRLALGGYPVKWGSTYRQDPCPPPPAAARSAAPCPPPQVTARAEPAPAPIPAYTAPHCLPKIPESALAPANNFVCEKTKAVEAWFNSWLPNCAPKPTPQSAAPGCK